MAKSDGSGRTSGLGDWARLHLWQIQPVRDVLLLAALFGILWAGYRASIVTVPLLLALLLAYLFEPVIRRVSRGDRTRRKLAAGGVILGVIGFVVVPLVLGLVWAGTNLVSLAAEIKTDVMVTRRVVLQETPPTEEELNEALPLKPGWQWVATALRDMHERDRVQAGIDAALMDDPAPTTEGEDHPDPDDGVDAWGRPTVEVTLGERIMRGLDPLWRWASEEKNQATIAKRAASTGLDALSIFLVGATGVGRLVFGGFLTAFFFFFVCIGYQGVLHWLRDLIPDRYRPRALHLLTRMDRVIAGFVRGRLTISLVLSVLFTIGYTIIGTPLPFVMGLATGLLSIVPYLALITVPPAIILMFLGPAEGIRGAWWWSLFAPIVLYYAVQSMDDYFLTPRIQGKQTDMDMPSILFASFAGAALFGVFGLLIAIPLAACIKILWIEVAIPRLIEWKQGRAADPLPIAEAPESKQE